jgi:hypothetical protein
MEILVITIVLVAVLFFVGFWVGIVWWFMWFFSKLINPDYTPRRRKRGEIPRD